MTLQVTLTLSQRVAQNAQRIAQQTQRPVEAVLAEWLDQAANDLPIEALSDRDVLALCDLKWPEPKQAELSALLANNQARPLLPTEQSNLDLLMREYDEGMLRKAQALRVAVQRGLRPPLSR